MEESSSSNLQQAISQWIVSLAISVTCCAILFVVFAGYLSDIKKNLAIENIQLEQMSIHEDQLLREIKALQHAVAANQGSVTTPEIAPATSTAPPSSAVAPASPIVPSTVPSAATPLTPPPLAPTAIPEVPAKK